ncbi:MAG: hypothetical protein AAF945_18485 [Actinomycetota bacterium]
MTAAIMAAGLLVTAGCFGDDGESDDDATAETEAPPETEAPADTEPDVETTTESQPPDETDAPAETEPPAANDAPSETGAPAETDAPPSGTEPPEAEDDLLILPEWETDTISRVTAELFIEAQANPVQIDPSEAYVGGTPDLSAPSLGLAGFATTTVATADVVLPTTWPDTWTIRSVFDTAYSTNIPEQTIAVAIFDGDPNACSGACGISFFGTQPGLSPIGPGEWPSWLFDDPGTNIFAEWTAAGGQSDVVFGLGNGAGFDRFADPSWIASNDSSAGHAVVIIAPFPVEGVAVFDAPDFTPTGASAEVLTDTQVADIVGAASDRFDALDATWIEWGTR